MLRINKLWGVNKDSYETWSDARLELERLKLDLERQKVQVEMAKIRLEEKRMETDKDRKGK